MKTSTVKSAYHSHVLTRSRSLAFPLTDIDFFENFSVSTSLSASKIKLSHEDIHQPMKECKTGKEKDFKRHKSLTELFHVFSFKSKNQLRGLFSRQDKCKETPNKTIRDTPCLSFPHQSDTAMRKETGCVMELKVEASAVASSPEKELQRQHMKEKEHEVKQCRHLDPLSRRQAQEKTRNRTPDELFCVTGEVSHMKQPRTSPIKDTIHQNIFRDKQRKADSTPTPTEHSRTKAPLAKSNSDSIYRLVQPNSSKEASLVKTPSDDTLLILNATRTPFQPRQKNLKTNKGPTDSCVSVILDWLLVGSIEAAYSQPLLCSMAVDAIIDITNVDPRCVPKTKKTTCPCSCRKNHFQAKLNLAVDDIEWENIEQHFVDINAFINGWRQRGSRVLVVSYHGKSRGPAAVVQHLMHYYRIPLARALAYVCSKHPKTHINHGFLRALQRLEKRMADQNSSASPEPHLPNFVSESANIAWEKY